MRNTESVEATSVSIKRRYGDQTSKRNRTAKMISKQITVVLISICAIMGSEGSSDSDVGGWSTEAGCLAECTTEGFVCNFHTFRWFCELADCGTPSQTANGSVVLCEGTTEYQDQAFYVCEAGFVLIGGDSPRTCTENETWSGTDPTCIADCGTPPTPTNGHVEYPGGTLVGDAAIFTCDQGYYQTAGIAFRICQADGTWDGTDVVCSPVDCGAPSPPANGAVNSSSGTVFGDIITYSCDADYGLDGCPYRTCLSDGSYSSDAPTCVLIHCPTLSAPTDGTVVNPDPRIVGSEATFNCSSGYALVGRSSLFCLEDITWSASAPSCEIECGSFTGPANGDIVFTGVTVGYMVTVTCHEGYVLSGNETRECLSTGLWSGTPASCDPINCGSLSDPSNGDVDTSDGTTYGAIAIYSCDSNYVLNGCENRVCLSDGSWSPSKPSCDPVQCSNLTDPSNGQVDTSSGILIGDTATYTCDAGYTLIGVDERYCTFGGSWTGSSPQCVMPCPPLAAPTHGDVLVYGNLPGDTASYSCDRGYELSPDDGLDSVVCNSGSWSSTYDCVEIICSVLYNPAFGGVNDGGRTFETTATYSCNSGYVLNGDLERTCLSDKSWSGSMPTCEPVDCGSAEKPCDGSVSAPVTKRGNVATYSCDQGFTLGSPTTRTCQDSGFWSGSVPCCDITECPDLTNDPPHGSVDTSGGHEVGDVATYSCDTCWTMEGEPTRTCLADGTWDGTVPNCTTPTHYFNDDAFYFFHCMRSWGEAQSICSNFGANLVKIEDSGVNNFIRGKLTAGLGGTGSIWWTGGSDAADEGTWLWKDTSSITYFDWDVANSQPDGGVAQNCIALKEADGYDWFDEDCTDMNPFICWIKDGAWV